jgi:protein ImuB
MRWACLLFPHLALDAVLRRHPAPDAPLALVTGPAHRRVLFAVNTAAAALALRSGMSVTAAQAITTTCALTEYDEEATARCRRLLAAWGYRFSSLVSTDFSGAIVLEVEQSLMLFGPWPRFEARLREELNDLGFRHRIVVAPNAYAARTLANLHDGMGVDDSTMERALGQVPVESSGLDADVATAFARMGLRRLRQVFALPRDTIARRFPPTVLAHLDALRGADKTPLTCYQPPDWFDEKIEFDHEVELHTALLFPLRRLTSDLGAYLSGRDGGVERFVLRFEHESVPATQIVVGLLAPERNPNTLFDLARGRLEQAEIAAPVRGMRLTARELPPFVPASRDLFDMRAQQTMPWEQLRERLRARLGDDAVHGLSTQLDHRPELAWSEEGPGKVAPIALADLRPGWLLERAIPWRGPAPRILAGPERIESGWWDSSDVRRDYYLVESNTGQRAWVYSALNEIGPFMIHGWFA